MRSSQPLTTTPPAPGLDDTSTPEDVSSFRSATQRPDEITETPQDKKGSVDEARALLSETGITHKKLIDEVLGHPFPRLVAQGLRLLIQGEYSRLEDLQTEPACIYRDLLLRIPKSPQGDEKRPIAPLIIICASHTNPLKRDKASTDLLKKILDFLGSQQEDPAQLYRATLIVSYILKVIKESHSDAKEFTIHFFMESENLLIDCSLLVLLKKLSIPYTKENLSFLRTKIPRDAEKIYKITEFIFTLSRHKLLTYEVFTTLVNQASRFKAIQATILHKNSAFFILICLTNQILQLSTRLSPEPAIFSTTTLASFLNSSEEEIRSALAIFKNLHLLRQSTGEPTPIFSAAGITNVLPCVINKKIIRKLDLTIRYLLRASPEGVVSPEAIQETFCSLPDLEKRVEAFYTLCEPNKTLIKKIILQNNRELLCKTLLAIRKFQALFENDYQLKTAEDSLPPPLTPLLTLEGKLCQHPDPDQLVTAFETFFKRINNPSIKSTYIALLTVSIQQKNPQQFLENRALAITAPPRPPIQSHRASTATTCPKASVTTDDLRSAEQLLEAHALLTPEKKEALKALFDRGENPLDEACLTVVCTPESRIKINDLSSKREGHQKAALLRAIQTLATLNMTVMKLRLEDKRAILQEILRTGHWVTIAILKILCDARCMESKMWSKVEYKPCWNLILLEPKKEALFYIFKALQASALPIGIQLKIVQEILERKLKSIEPIQVAISFFMNLMYEQTNPMPASVQNWIQTKTPPEVFSVLLTAHAAAKEGRADRKSFETLITPPAPDITTVKKIGAQTGLTDQSLLIKIAAHQHAIDVVVAVAALHKAGLLYAPLDASSGAEGTRIRKPYLKLILYGGILSSKNKNLVQLITRLGQKDLLNETVLNLLVAQHQKGDLSSLEEAILLIDNFHQCNIPLTKANLEFAGLVSAHGEKIAAFCHRLAQHHLLNPSSFSLLILQEDESLTTAERSHRLSDKYVALLSQSVRKLEPSADSSPPLPESEKHKLDMFIDLLKIDALTQALWDKVEKEDHFLWVSLKMLKNENLLHPWSVKTIITNLNVPASIHLITVALVQLKQDGIPIEQIRHDFAALLITQKKPVAWAQKMVVLYHCGYTQSTEILEQLEALEERSTQIQAIEILYSVKNVLEHTVTKQGLAQILEHANPPLLARVLVLILQLRERHYEDGGTLLANLLQSKNLEVLKQSILSVQKALRSDPYCAFLCQLLAGHQKPDDLATVFVLFYEKYARFASVDKLHICKKYAAQPTPLALYQAQHRNDTPQGHGALFSTPRRPPKRREDLPSEERDIEERDILEKGMGARKKKRKTLEGGEAAETPITQGAAAESTAETPTTRGAAAEPPITMPVDIEGTATEKDETDNDNDTVWDGQSLRGTSPRSTVSDKESNDGMDDDDKSTLISEGEQEEEEQGENEADPMDCRP